MAEDNSLFAIEVDADDYAETAAGDTPSVSRTYQSEEAFAAIKASYTAKIDGGKTYEDLISAVPLLDDGRFEDTNKVKLSKKDVQLLGYAVGEMYFSGDFAGVLELCGRVRGRCVVDGDGGKMEGMLERWEGRCRRGRMGG